MNKVNKKLTINKIFDCGPSSPCPNTCQPDNLFITLRQALFGKRNQTRRNEKERKSSYILCSACITQGQCTYYARTKAKLLLKNLHFRSPCCFLYSLLQLSTLFVTLHISSIKSTFLPSSSGLPWREAGSGRIWNLMLNGHPYLVLAGTNQWFGWRKLRKNPFPSLNMDSPLGLVEDPLT